MWPSHPHLNEAILSRSCHALCEIPSERRKILVLRSEARDAEFAKIIPSSEVGAIRAGIFGCTKLYMVIYVVCESDGSLEIQTLVVKIFPEKTIILRIIQ
jgi:hypothetical protein